jgi:antitoxin (DNA-binding transcriptional repressor) of toxin-antitoxin stability system
LRKTAHTSPPLGQNDPFPPRATVKGTPGNPVRFPAVKLWGEVPNVKDGEKVVVTEHNKIIAEIVVPDKNNRKEISLIEKKLEQLSREGEIVLAKRNKSCVKIPETKEKLNWELIYNEVRADRTW